MTGSDNTKRELLLSLNETIGPTWKEFTGNQANDLARGLIAQQDSRWESILEIFESLGQDEFDEYCLSTLRKILEIADEPTVVGTGNSFTVESSLPLIVRDPPTVEIATAQSFRTLTFAFIISKCRRYLTRLNLERGNPLLISLTFAEMETLLAEIKEPNKRNQIEHSSITAFEKTAETAKLKLSEIESYYEEKKAAGLKNSQQIEQALSDLTKGEEARQNAWNDERESALAGLRREVMEFTKVESSVDLWQSKARWHLVGFGSTAAVFAATLIATPFFIAYQGLPFIENLATRFTGDKQYLGLALLVIPAVAIGWLLRFLARIAIQNLGLAQDARQRHAQILTYLRLLGDGSQPISKDERILALSAIFRPIPGQGTDDINPPTIADLFREAIERVQTPK